MFDPSFKKPKKRRSAIRGGDRGTVFASKVGQATELQANTPWPYCPSVTNRIDDRFAMFAVLIVVISLTATGLLLTMQMGKWRLVLSVTVLMSR